MDKIKKRNSLNQVRTIFFMLNNIFQQLNNIIYFIKGKEFNDYQS